MANRARIRLKPKERIERRFAMAKAYVNLDRMYYFHPANASAVEKTYEEVRALLRSETSARRAFDQLCKLGAVGDEVLWLLSSCRGNPGVLTLKEGFGWSPDQLDTILRQIRNAANAIERTGEYVFGAVVKRALFPDGEKLAETLRSYVSFAAATKDDFSHGSRWFLSLAKARLVIHVRSQTQGKFRDAQISALVAAFESAGPSTSRRSTIYDEDTIYGPAGQARWRKRYAYLIKGTELDGYAAMSAAQLAQARKNLSMMFEQGGLDEYDRRLATQYLQLIAPKTTD